MIVNQIRDTTRGLDLDGLFDAKSVAVIGASGTPGKWGFGIMSIILMRKGDREVYAVNKKGGEVLGLKAYPSLVEVPGTVDCAVIATTAQYTAAVMEDCVRKRVKFAVLFPGGFAEVGEEGAKAQREVVEIARRGGVRIVGPNCMGHFDAYSGFFTLPYEVAVKEGSVSVITQSGNSGVAILTMLSAVGLGLSKYVSSGNEADLHFEDYLEYAGRDERTGIVLGYVEGLREGRRFFELAGAISRRKPIVILKAGQSDDGARAARSHTGALAGTEEVSTAAFRQTGVIKVDEISDLVDTALAFEGQPLPRGRRIGLISMGGGLGVLSADALRNYRLELAQFSSRTMDTLNSVLSDRWSHGNPVDPAGDPVVYPLIWPLLEDENVDAIMVVGGIGVVGGLATLLPVHPSLKDEYARLVQSSEQEEMDNLDRLLELRDKYRKPIVVARTVSGYKTEETSRVADKMKQSYLTPYPSPGRAARALSRLVEYSEYLGIAEGTA
jgi:acyl-CoA synthetase (NDP forming)